MVYALIIPKRGIYFFKWSNSAYFFKPISRNLSSRYSPAVASGYAFGWLLSIQLSKQAKFISLLGCKKNGIENRLVCQSSLFGFTTLWVVLQSLLLVNLCNISPTFTTIWSGKEVTPTHSPSLVNICKPSAEAPTNKQVKWLITFTQA